MKMAFQDKIDKYRLIAKVERSKSDEQTENDVNSAIKEATDILKAAYKSEKQELHNKFRKEYQDLKISVLNSLKEDRKITKNELTKIKLELGDITNLAQKNNIGEKTSLFGKISNKFTGANLEGIKKKVQNIKEKDINDYTKDEAIGALEYLNGEYSSGKYKEIGYFSKAITFNNKTINHLNDKYEVRKFQDKLVKTILGNNKEYNNEYIKSYNSKIGNHLVKISDFENKINNNEKINLETTALYLLKLNEENPNKKGFINSLRSSFGERYNKILEAVTMKSKSENKDKAKEILEKYGIFKQGGLIEEFFNGIFEKFENVISSVGNFFNGIEELNEKNAGKFIEFLKENKEYLEGEFRKNLLEKFDGIENKEEIVQEFIDKLLKAENIFEIRSIIKTYNEKYLVNLDGKETAKKTLEIKKTETEIKALEAKQKGNTREYKKMQLELIQYEKSVAINEYATERQIKQAIERFEKGETFEVIIDDIKKDNKKLSKEFEKVEELEKEIKQNIEKQKKENNNIGEKNEDKNKETKKEEKNNKETIVLKNGEEITFLNLESGNYNINSPKTGEKLEISKEEKKAIEKNPETLKNIENFYIFFKEINLKSAWEYRKNLINAMGDVTIKLEDNSLTKSELIKFGNNLINFINNSRKSVGENEINLQNSNNLIYIKQELKKYSGANSSLNDKKTYNRESEDRLGKDLRNLKIIKNGAFKVNFFRDIINGKK